MYMDGSFEIIKEFDPEIAQMTIAEEQRQLNTHDKQTHHFTKFL